MSEFRAKPSGTGWVLQEKWYGIWRTLHNVYCAEASWPKWFATLEEAKAEAERLKELDAAAEAIKQARREHEAQPPVPL